MANARERGRKNVRIRIAYVRQEKNLTQQKRQNSYTSDSTELSTRLDETEAQRVNSTNAIELGRQNAIKFVYKRRDNILAVYDRHSSYKKSTETIDATKG